MLVPEYPLQPLEIPSYPDSLHKTLTCIGWCQGYQKSYNSYKYNLISTTRVGHPSWLIDTSGASIRPHRYASGSSHLLVWSRSRLLLTHMRYTNLITLMYNKMILSRSGIFMWLRLLNPDTPNSKTIQFTNCRWMKCWLVLMRYGVATMWKCEDLIDRLPSAGACGPKPHKEMKVYDLSSKSLWGMCRFQGDRN